MPLLAEMQIFREKCYSFLMVNYENVDQCIKKELHQLQYFGEGLELELQMYILCIWKTVSIEILRGGAWIGTANVCSFYIKGLDQLQYFKGGLNWSCKCTYFVYERAWSITILQGGAWNGAANVRTLYMKGLHQFQYVEEGLELELQMYVISISKGVLVFYTSKWGLNWSCKCTYIVYERAWSFSILRRGAWNVVAHVGNLKSKRLEQ